MTTTIVSAGPKPKETVTGGLRLRTAIKAGLNFTKICF